MKTARMLLAALTFAVLTAACGSSPTAPQSQEEERMPAIGSGVG